MPSLEEKLITIVKTRLDGEADLETLENDHVCGHVISPHFVGLDFHDRRQLIKKAIQEALRQGELNDDDMPLISTLLTYTPAEWSVVLTDTE